MEKITIPMVYEYGLHLASLFLFIFCLLNYKIIFDNCSHNNNVFKKTTTKNDFIRLDVECTNNNTRCAVRSRGSRTLN